MSLVKTNPGKAQGIPEDADLPTVIRVINDRFRRLPAVNASTPTVSAGTHATRLPADLSSYPAGSLWFEVDRGNVCYQVQSPNATTAWVYVSGMMYGTFKQRPADLGTTDAGFLYCASDDTGYRWNGKAWTSVPQARVLLDEGASPANSQAVIKANALGALSLLCEAAGNAQIGFDVEWNASGWIARAAVCAWLFKAASLLYLCGSTGNTVGTSATQNKLAAFDPSNGNIGVGGNIAPAYALDATGDVNASGVFRKGGTAGETGPVTLTYVASISGAGISDLTITSKTVTFNGGIETSHT